MFRHAHRCFTRKSDTFSTVNAAAAKSRLFNDSHTQRYQVSRSRLSRSIDSCWALRLYAAPGTGVVMATIEKRLNKKSTTAYYIKIRLKGHPVQYASFSRLTDAKRWAQSTEAAIHEGRHFKTNEAKKHTLGDAIKRYRKEVLPHKPGCARSQPHHLDWWEQEAGYYAVAPLFSYPPAIAGNTQWSAPDPVRVGYPAPSRACCGRG